jgi:hypothetical protein
MMSERPSLDTGHPASGIALRMQQCREFDVAKKARRATYPLLASR